MSRRAIFAPGRKVPDVKKNQQDMLDDIDAEVRYTRSLIGKDALDPRVMEAMRKVPRDAFVPPNMTYAAFENGITVTILSSSST